MASTAADISNTGDQPVEKEGRQTRASRAKKAKTISEGEVSLDSSLSAEKTKEDEIPSSETNGIETKKAGSRKSSTDSKQEVIDDVPELEEAPPTSVVQITSRKRTTSIKLNSKKQVKDDAPELEEAPPPSVVQTHTRSAVPSLKLRKSISKGSTGPDDDIQEVPVEKMEVDVIEVPDADDEDDEEGSGKKCGKGESTEAADADEDKEDAGDNHMEGMTVIDEVTDETDKQKVEANSSFDPDTEMVSEDELPAESSKEPLETEAVSDEELPATAAPDLPETEAVSEDELPPEGSEKKKKKKKEGTEDQSKEVSKEQDGTNSNKLASAGEGAVKRKLVDGEYDPSSPTSEASNDEVPSKKMAVDKSASKQPAKPAKLPELEKYWKAVKDDPSDFTGWTYLLQYVDQENDVEAAREAYDSFLSHYPYCYGYWRKFADYEKRKGNKRKGEEVFERGLKAIPLSVDLWIHYLNYCKVTYVDDEDFLRAQFEKALAACGLEFRSDRLWESYIKWEAEAKRVHNVTLLYDKLLTIPTQGYTNHFESFQEHVGNNLPAKVLSVDEFLTLRREVLQVLKQYDAPMKLEEGGPPGDDDAAPPGEEPAEAPATKSDEETTALRERIISIRRKVHKATVSAVTARWNFEEGIKRPYFHVKPLERCQLKNWKEYLDFEIEQGNQERIIILFERCLIACALYEDFWMRFIKYLEDKASDMTEKISDVYQRACTIHHPKKPNLHLRWAVYEESQGHVIKAREILANLDKVVPGLIQIAYRRINLERRAGNFDEASILYEHYINTAKTRIITNNMVIKYARFCWKILDDLDKAISVMKKAIEKDKENPRLYLQMIDIAMQKTPVDEAEVLTTIDQFIARETADMDQKLMFAQRKVEFLEDFGSNVKNVVKASEEFRRYMKIVKEKKKKELEAKPPKLEEDKKSKSSSGPSQHSSAPPPTASQTSQPPSTSGPYPPNNYGAPAYSGAGPQSGSGYQNSQGGYPPQQPPYSQPPYNQPYNQSDPNYANYQNWGYSQPGYGNYNQGWGGGGGSYSGGYY